MKKIDSTEFSHVLKDVRASYRLLALYQRRLMDTVKFIGNSLGFKFTSGWAKFSHQAPHGNRANIDRWSWDWLPMYFYDFNMGERVVSEQKYYLKLIHLADTGFYDIHEGMSDDEITPIKKLAIEEFADVRSSSSKLLFILSNVDGYPITNTFKKDLHAKGRKVIYNNGWLGVAFSMEEFLNEVSTARVLQEFNGYCKQYFQIDFFQ